MVTAVPVAPVRLGALDQCTACDRFAKYQVGPDRRHRFCSQCVGYGLDQAAEDWDGWAPLTVDPLPPSPAQLWAMAAASPLSPAGGETT